MLHPALQLIETDGRGTEHVGATRRGHTLEAVYVNQHFFFFYQLIISNAKVMTLTTQRDTLVKKGHISHKAVIKYAKAGSGKDRAL